MANGISHMAKLKEPQSSEFLSSPELRLKR
jgi:hypothetical protein